VGADLVAPLLATSRLGGVAAAAPLQQEQVNGHPALILRLGGKIDTVITGLYAVRNPEKLSRLEWETALRG
jgi:hypothetical protein